MLASCDCLDWLLEQPDDCVPFCGSGTTGAAAIKHGRQFVGLDIRQSQIELTERRLAEAREKLQTTR